MPKQKKVREYNYVDLLQNYINRKGLTIKEVADTIQISRSAVSTYLSSKYQGNVSALEQKIISLIKAEEERENDVVICNYHIVTDCIKTSNFKKIIDTARMSQLEKEIGLIYGDAGLGKTTAIKEYTRVEPNAVLIEATKNYTPRVLFSKIHEKIGLGKPKAVVDQIFESVKEKIENTEILLIIDEAEYLPVESLELLRRLHDMGNVPILLVGLPKLLGNLKGRYADFRQLYSRIGVSCCLDNLTPADVQEFIFQNFGEVENEVLKQFYILSKSNARHLVKLIKRVKKLMKLNEDEVVDPEIIQAAANILVI